VSAVLEAPPGQPSLARLAVLVATVVSTVMGVTVATRSDWERYGFQASSAAEGFVTRGRLGDAGPYELIFHSNVEDGPWMEIDLLRSRTVRRVLVMNGIGCCRHRGVPLVLELAGDDKRFVEVARQDHRFEVWDTSFAPRVARYARIRAIGRTVLHPQAIELR
jgi:hypothetical protein